MTGMYDFHCHTTLSDGGMLPIELIRRMAVLGYSTVAISDHVDATNLHHVIDSVSRLKPSASLFGVNLFCGVEITHVPPEEIPGIARQAKELGADLVLVHGETTVEPVAGGTNEAAVRAPDVDILVHPGLISHEDASIAAENDIYLEITSRNGHNRTNGHLVKVARDTGCRMLVQSDAHEPRDLLDSTAKWLVARGAGLTEEEAERVLAPDPDLIRRFSRL
ncbi:MAG: histidinol phosphate phosphatase domain-containing protein [Methanocalculus sp. MSAO_Arc1]|uniref:histidinol phosphate phosphatase domain-containing protein n=2 Tax=Methanocalculaceae TaxID=1460864 RepID=UPI000FEF9332|nr:histidinol phosphate phosphatase domain-containing protein [Methanocalculus sp. AMF5]MCP1662597.1 histidinol phosphatase-like PHP family hydrolase [Methanocalculus sp. AMF5]RQD78948.1 MAG: histidinol phosphate phosphatase domain-containing protein [Methanocalculus sp. MSAO_Arc1]